MHYHAPLKSKSLGKTYYTVDSAKVVRVYVMGDAGIVGTPGALGVWCCVQRIYSKRERLQIIAA